MKWQRVFAVLGVVGFLHMLAIVAVARPWLPQEQMLTQRHFKDRPDMALYLQRVRTLSWHAQPGLAYSTITHARISSAKTTTLTLGFLTVTVAETVVGGSGVRKPEWGKSGYPVFTSWRRLLA